MRAFAVPEATTTHIVEVELPTPTPEGTDVLLTVVRSGCATPTPTSGRATTTWADAARCASRTAAFPTPWSWATRSWVVTAVGPDVEGVEVGSTRLVYPWVGCGDCPPCLDGRENACPRGRNIGVARAGGYADQVLVPHPRYLVDIEGLDVSWAATMACSGLTAYSAALKVLPLPPDVPVAVIGVGGVGLTAVATLSALGHRAICAVDTSAANLAAAQELGASLTVTAGGDDLAGKLVATCGGPVAAAIDFVNNDHTAPAVFDALAKGGHMVQVGLFGGELTIPTALLALKMITIQGSFVGTLPELHEVVGLAKRGNIPRIPVHDAHLDLAGVTDSLDRLAAGGVTGRIVLKGAGQ